MTFSVKNIILLFLLSLFISCESKNTTSFKDLRDAFVQWNQKNHVDAKYDFSHNYFKRYNTNLIRQYVEDLKRFDLELSQVNVNNLLHDLKTDYAIINDRISNYLFEIKIYDSSRYEGIFFIEHIFTSIDLLINMDVELYSKVYLLESHLKNVSTFIRDYKKIVYLIDESQKNILNKKIIALISYVNEIPTNLNLVDDDYIQIETNIDEIVILLNKMNYWFKYNYEFTSFEKIYISNDNKYKQEIKNFFEKSDYEYQSIIKFIKTNIKSIQKKLIDDCILIYNKNNDEPVWDDKSDTINVINWVKWNELNSITILKENYLEDFEDAYRLVDNNINHLNLTNYSELTPIFKENVNNDIVDQFLYSNNKNVYTLNISNSIPFINKYDFNDMIFNKIIPEFNIKNSFDQNLNLLMHLYNPITNKGFSLFLENILVLNNFTKDSLYKINFYINLLEKYSIVLSQNDLFVNGYSENRIIENLSSDNFISINESKNFFKNIDKDEFYIGEVIVFLHLLNLYEDKCIIDSSMSVTDYIDSILSKGNIPFYLFK